MRSGRRPGEAKEDVGSGGAVGWRAGHRKDGARAGCESGAWDKSALLPDRRERDLFGRSEEDGGAHGELSACHW